jgi:hypothetical protein
MSDVESAPALHKPIATNAATAAAVMIFAALARGLPASL